ncbi:dihydrofolate reductase [Pararhizobium capsulatum DSM 1112]|uniref:Dihydrofolate reductase n=1 Tax=Pararhizobium capsulatum DSM 1112 TaxID=1121113 RepID=A0ABU0BRF5_9HYPH|nr:dihydrofolate reductase [Pararhizobium capsulatum]MDQ0320832.1 dihydrofolate reductase [Pararhizobium capsulatum DSM 1112]
MTDVIRDVPVEIVVAVAENGVIGHEGDLPWRLPTDLKRFKTLTMGKPIVMGRKTWVSLGRPLPGRPNIVVTRDAAFTAEGAIVVNTVDAALATAQELARETGVSAVSIIGGGEIYRQTIDRTDTLYVTEVAAEVDGDTRFPDIDPELFEKVSEEPIPQGEKDSHAMNLVVWQRKSALR